LPHCSLILPFTCFQFPSTRFELGPANNRARADLDRSDAAVVNQLVEKSSGDPEMVCCFIYGEA
jgi:hypothetical protein